MKLAPQPWMTLSGARTIMAALDVADGNTRLVGGAVRDALAGLAVTDVDFATRFGPEEVARRLATGGVQVVPTGIAHGTVTAVTEDIKIEITTLRRDVSTDGRRAAIAYTSDWREDAARRDFTINALYADLESGEIDDFFGGTDDLLARRVRFIGDPLTRIAEDHLRILRFFRFQGRFGGTIPDAAALDACAARANDLMALSRERVRDELLKILALSNAEAILTLMFDVAVLAPVLPELAPKRLAELALLVGAEAAAGVPPQPLPRLAALLPADAELLADIAARLRLSRRESARLVALAERYEERPQSLAAECYWFGAEAVSDRLLLAGLFDARTRAELDDWSRPPLPISGRDIIARGVDPGPEVSRRLKAFERRWVAAGFPADAASIDRLLKLGAA
jgi:poly(A) polymerase